MNLSCNNLCFHYRDQKEDLLKHIHLSLSSSSTVAVVGESGSGKSTLAFLLSGLLKAQTDAIAIDGRPIKNYRRRQWCKHVQIIFQSPQEALNPFLKVDQLLREPLQIHFPWLSRCEQTERINQLLLSVALAPEMRERFPNQLSGGQKQRVCIARALAVEPDFLICDEIVSALDASIQQEILQLLKEIFHRRHFAMVFITHDLAIVPQICERVVVLQQGKIVEQGNCDQIYHRPQHPYTRLLLDNAF